MARTKNRIRKMNFQTQGRSPIEVSEEHKYIEVSAPLSLGFAIKGETHLISLAKKAKFSFWAPIEVDTKPGCRQLVVNPSFSYKEESFLVKRIFANFDCP